MTNHKNRVPKKPNRVLVTPEGGGAPFYATVTRADEPVEEGCPLNKVVLDELLAGSGTTAGTATALTLAQDGFNLVDGATVRFKLHVDSGATPTLNVNGSGAKRLMETATKAMRAGTKAGIWITATYSSTLGFFVLQGSGEGKLATKRIGDEPGQVNLDQISYNPLGLGRTF